MADRTDAFSTARTLTALSAALAAYEAEIELQCVRVLAGGRRGMVLATDLRALCRRVLQVRPDCEGEVIDLVDAHRLVLAGALGGGSVPAARRSLARALDRLRIRLAR